MAVYLIDYENVNTDGLNGISRLSEGDTVIIFYSDNADRMTFGLHRRLNESKAAIDIRKVEVGGSNALDFQLGTYLGYLIAKNPEEQYCIVSNDRGYSHVAGFWTKQKMKVQVVAEICSVKTEPAEEVPAEEPAPPAKPEKRERSSRSRRKSAAKPAAPVSTELSEILPLPEEAAMVEGFIEKYKTKQGLNNALVRKFGNTRGGELYQKLKPLIADKKGC